MEQSYSEDIRKFCAENDVEVKIELSPIVKGFDRIVMTKGDNRINYTFSNSEYYTLMDKLRFMLDQLIAKERKDEEDKNNRIYTVGFKGFESDWSCRGYHYKLGETHTMPDDIEMCMRGFHFCVDPLETFWYYEPINEENYKYALVASGKNILTNENNTWPLSDFDSKVCTNEITLICDVTDILLRTSASALRTVKCDLDVFNKCIFDKRTFYDDLRMRIIAEYPEVSPYVQKWHEQIMELLDKEEIKEEARTLYWNHIATSPFY